MDLYGVLFGIGLVSVLFGLRRWRQSLLARAVGMLSQDERCVLADSPWFCPPPDDMMSGALPGYARLYHRSLWPMRLTVATWLAALVTLALLLDGGIW